MPHRDERDRLDPDELLRLTRADGSGRGRLKVYLGMAAGVGKTVRMLDDARGMRAAGIDIAAGLVETHGRAETAAHIADLEVIPRRKVAYRDVVIESVSSGEGAHLLHRRASCEQGGDEIDLWFDVTLAELERPTDL